MGLFKKDKLQIICFQGYGTNDRLHLRGRALEDEIIDLEQKGFLALVLNTWKRFDTDEIKHAKIKIKAGDSIALKTNTDSNGYYLINQRFEHLSRFANTEGWLPVELSFATDNLNRSINNNNRFVGEMLIPCADSDYGVISDIDDTILHTGVVSSLKWRVLVNTIFKRAGSRDALEGTADFYHKLHRGKSGLKLNPIFYVSHSPWNLYRYLELFLKINNFPKGPILLRSISSFRAKNRKSPTPQKHHEIVAILKSYPGLSFILIGDGGEKDGDIYIDIAKKFPEQIKAIYLRSVADNKRVKRVSQLFKEFKEIPFLLVDKTNDAIQHAKANGFI
jgi:phosphatidate phosphatase APP1